MRRLTLTQGRYGKESYERIQQRRQAAVILDNPELLMMHAQARQDVNPLPYLIASQISKLTSTQSIPGTRHYFTKMLCGYLDEKGPYAAPLLEEQSEKSKLKQYKEAQTSKMSL